MTMTIHNYEVSYGALHPIFYYYLIFSTFVFLSVCKPPGFYKKIISWLMNLKVKVAGAQFKIYSLLIFWILFLLVIITCK